MIWSTEDPLRLALRRATCSLCAACLALAAPLTALAQEAPPPSEPPASPERNPEEAVRLYQIGQLQFEGKEFEAAAETFSRAFALDPNAVLAYNAARAYENNGDMERARDFYQRALGLDPKPDVEQRCNDALIRLERTSQRLREQLVKETALEVTSSPQATLWIDGQEHGLTPQTVKVAQGQHMVELRAGSHRTHRQEVTLEGGQQLVVSVQLDELEDYPWLRWTGWGVTGVGALMIAGGAVVGADARQTYQDAQSLEAQRDPTLFEELRSTGEQQRDQAQALYGSGGLFMVVGLGLVLSAWLLGDDPDEVAQPAVGGLQWWVTPQQVGAAVTW